MSHITGYACVFSSKTQTFSFALELKGEPGTASFAVLSADAAETEDDDEEAMEDHGGATARERKSA